MTLFGQNPFASKLFMSLFHNFSLFLVMADGSHFGWSIFEKWILIVLLFSVLAAILDS